MRILQVTHYMPPHPGGIERVAETLFQGYADAGLDVQWVSSRIPVDAPAAENGKRRVPALNVLERTLAVPVPLWGPRGVRTLAQCVQSADIVHVHDCLYPTSAVAVQLARRAGRATLLTQHVGFVEYASRLINAVESSAYATLGRAVLRRATHLVLATPAAEAYARSLLGRMPQNATIIPNGIDLRRFDFGNAPRRNTARQALGVSADDVVVLFAGRLVHKKGIPLVLASARRLPQMRFIVLGDGPLASMMSALPGNVTWVRGVSQSQMVQYYHAADCLLLPSHGEGLPLVIQEAFSCGLPAVVSDDSAYAQPLAAQSLLQSVSRDSDVIAEAIRVVTRNTDEDLRRALRTYAEQHWDAEKMKASYVELAQRIVRAVVP